MQAWINTSKQFVLSVDIRLKNPVAAATGYSRIGTELRLHFSDGTTSYKHAFVHMPAVTAYNGRLKVNQSVPEGKTVVSVQVGMIQANYSSADEVYVGNPKLELGTLATDWTPAPEDVDTAVAESNAKITALQKTVATANQAQAEENKTLKATIGDHAAKITSASKAIVDLDGKVKATHNIKVESTASGRKVIAGIALGVAADSKTVESSVIVMADKFGVVKNASDGNVVPMLSVVNNRVAVNGDLIADGTILGKHIRANQTLTAPNINGGSLNIGNGKFSVSSNGQVIIRNSSANIGLVMTNERIDVYDEFGNLKVRLGKLR